MSLVRLSTYTTKRIRAPVVYDTHLAIERFHENKVPHIYVVDAETLLIVTADRLDALGVEEVPRPALQLTPRQPQHPRRRRC
jgi:hypothetical protein